MSFAMRPKGRAWFTTAPLIVSVSLLAILPSATQGASEKHLSLDAESLCLVDLIGEVRVEAGSGPAFEVSVRIGGNDAREDLIRIETEEGKEARVVCRFPTEREHEYVYPRLGRTSNEILSLAGLRGEGHGFWDWIRGDDQIKVRGSGPGTEVWADVTIRVPAGRSVEVHLGVGSVAAEGVEGRLSLETQSGPVTAIGIKGDLVADTGSGSIEAMRVEGSVHVDTGSGPVEVKDITGPEVIVDTGSGAVEADRIDCRRLDIDTGSGGVRAGEIRADEVHIDTGSGFVDLALARMGSGRFVVDTGSGSIDLSLPGDASAQVVADTGSGSIQVDLGSVQIRGEETVSFRLGSGAAELVLDTGSGPISIHK